MTARLLVSAMLISLPLAGCADPREPYGKTWYIDGVGNWGFGVNEMQQGLRAAHYPGHVDNFRWSVTFNPVLDQTVRVFAKTGAARLTGEIKGYLDRYPDGEVNLIGLSAGTGVAVWATEGLDNYNRRLPEGRRYAVRNLVLLGSSLSNTYDTRKALRNMTGDIYVYYSPSDTVLQGPAKLLGTIDGRFDDSAGLTGLRGPGIETGRIHNVAWQPSFAALGWTGSHTDCTSEPFVREVLAQHVLTTTPRRGVTAELATDTLRVAANPAR
ncbi:MAG: hypothetical protein L6R00_13995 [Phycisphaerae bacterium]|nr:hypothetical protein [Phycisphaerae bacterium]